MKARTLAALAWATLILAASRSEPAAAWLAIWTMAFAPLALLILVALAPERRGFIVAVDAEALAWSQVGAPPDRPRKNRAAPVYVRSGIPIRGLAASLPASTDSLSGPSE